MTIIAGDIGRFDDATSIAATDKIIIYQDGVLRKATPDQLATGASAMDGAASSTDNAAIRFDGTTGKLAQNSGVIIDDTNGVTGILALTGTTLNAGASGTAGTINVYPTTALKGRTAH